MKELYNKKYREVDALPCPCCGSTKLYTGYFDSDTAGIKCVSCGLSMGTDIYVSYTDEDELEAENIIKYLELDGDTAWRIMAVMKSVEKWNKRV